MEKEIMKKITEKRFKQLWKEVEDTLEFIEPKNYHDGMKKVLANLEKGKTLLEIFYCGIITEHILNHMEEDMEEEEAEEREIEEEKYIN